MGEKTINTNNGHLNGPNWSQNKEKYFYSYQHKSQRQCGNILTELQI